MAKQISIPKPTKIPHNWCWIELGKLTSMKSGFPFDSKRFTKSKSANTRPLIRIRDVINGVTETYTDQECPEEYVIKKGEILIGMDGDFNVGKWQSEDALLNQRVCCIQSCSSLYLDDFLFYYLPDPLKKINDATPSVTVKHLSTKTISITPVPVPPLPEQQRIVDRIESLFAKLDEAKQKAQEALDSFETRKAAILHKAFTGELTAQWRIEHGVGMESWDNAALQDVCEKIVCGKTPTGSIHPTGEIPYLKVYNIVDNNIDFKSTPQFIPKEIHEGKLKSSILKPNDVVMNIVGPPLRKIAIIPDDYPEWNMNQAIVRFRPGASLQYRFLYYALVNPETLDGVISETKGVVGQANISVTQSRNLVIPLPSVSEQTEIIRILDDLLAKEQQAREAAEGVLEQIDLIKKAILARAFRGELGTNDPNEESAVELVKKCLHIGGAACEN